MSKLNLENKNKLLQLLRQKSLPASISELTRELDGVVSERTIRRWLVEFVDRGLVETLGNRKSTRYIAVGHVALDYINQPIFNRSPKTYNKSWLESYIPNTTFYLPEDIRQDLKKQGIRESFSEPVGTYAHKICRRLLVDLSYNSSRLEGNTYSLLDTEKLIMEGKPAEGKLDEERIMILNHTDAIKHLVDNAYKIKIDFDEICTLHYLLSDGLVPSNYAGKVRDHGVRINSSTYVPLENPGKIEQQLKYICEKANAIEDIYEQSFFLLVHISYLQAFTDVNKRTARLCANIPLVKNNVVPCSFKDIARADYMQALLAVYELNDISAFLKLYEITYFRTCLSYDATAVSLGFDELRVRYRTQRREVIRHIILNLLVGDSMEKYITSESSSKIPNNDLSGFIEDVYDDLNNINPQRIGGLGISKEQLEEWLALYKSS